MMPRFIRKQTKNMGLPPGSLVHMGERKSDRFDKCHHLSCARLW